MAKTNKNEIILMTWSKKVPITGGQDPLSLNLRVSARISRELLFGITSVTPRARYYSFLPWCIWYINKYGNNNSIMNELIPLIERYMVIACLLKHGDKTCEEGALVGSTAALKWLASSKRKKIERVSFADNPAWKIYRASLLDLGLFKVTQEIYQDQDNEDTDFDETEELHLSWDEVELSDLGQQIANSYGGTLQNLSATKKLLVRSNNKTMESLKKWGNKSCLCNLKLEKNHDREMLRKLFFSKLDSPNETPCHEYRRDSLLLILECIKKINRMKLSFYDGFKQIAYFGYVLDHNDKRKKIGIPKILLEISSRWKMFYFHYYLSVSLEIIFIQVVSECQKAGISGFEWRNLLKGLYSKKVTKEVGEYLGVDLKKKVGEYSLSELLKMQNIDSTKFMKGEIEKNIPLNHDLSEFWLDFIPEENFFKKPASMAIATVYLLVCLLRYLRWEDTEYGKWLSGECLRTNAPNKNVSVPVILNSLKYEYGEWMNIPVGQLSKHIINRYVVNLHGILSYDKSSNGNNALFRREGEKLFWNNIHYEDVSAGNPRLPSAITILIDLGFITRKKDSKDSFDLTKDGSKILAEHLNRSI